MKRGTGAGADSGHCLAHCNHDIVNIAAINRHCRHAERRGQIRELSGRDAFAYAGGNRVPVVVADQQQGQLPQRGDVECLVQCAGAAGAVAENAARNRAGFQLLLG